MVCQTCGTDYGLARGVAAVLNSARDELLANSTLVGVGRASPPTTTTPGPGRGTATGSGS